MGRRNKGIAYDPTRKNRGKGRRRGNVSVDIDAANLTGSLTFYSPPIPPGEGYIIVSDSNTTTGISAGSARPVFWTADDSTIVGIVNGLPGNTTTVSTVAGALNYLASNDYYVIGPDKQEAEIPTDGLVLELDPSNPLSYPGTGNKMYDLSGNGNDATIYNSPYIDSSSVGYIQFDGSNDYLQITRDSSMDGWNTEQTVAMWISHSYTSGRRNPWNQAYGGYGTWTHEQGNYLNQYFGDAGNNTSPYLGQNNNANPPARHQWNFIAATRNTSQHKWYTNGDLVSTRNHSYGTLTTDNNNVLIGRGYAGYWIGKMGKITAYDKALSADEIKQLYLSSPYAYTGCQTAKDILDTYPELEGKDGYYWVWPDGDNPVKVYCDMTLDGGGWMLLARSHPSTVNYGGTNWGWRGNQIGLVDDFDEAYQAGWETWHDAGATFSEFAYGNRKNLKDNAWGPFVYKYYNVNYTNLITSDTQQSYSRTALKTDTSVYGFAGNPGMQNAQGYATTGTNNNLYYLRDCCGFSYNYGGKPNSFGTTYCNRSDRLTNSGPFCHGSGVDSAGAFEQGGTLYGSYLHGGSLQYMIMVR